mmetsp:Transcript_35702/g.35341  ORF Transcript_35702/g.35341 Transcript_35702/m.35341 type:complete len:233 (-) Transcript_35702:460-1158(-)
MCLLTKTNKDVQRSLFEKIGPIVKSFKAGKHKKPRTRDASTSMDDTMSAISEYEQFHSLTPSGLSCNTSKKENTRTTSTQTHSHNVGNDKMLKTSDDLKLFENKVNTPFHELFNSSGSIRKYDTSITHTATSKANEPCKENSGAATFDRKMSAKVRPASVVNHLVGRYTPIGKLEMTYDISAKDKKNMKKLKAITEANFKSKSTSMNSNNRRTRAKKSAGRVERSKQILSRS